MTCLFLDACSKAHLHNCKDYRCSLQISSPKPFIWNVAYKDELELSVEDLLGSFSIAIFNLNFILHEQLVSDLFPWYV